MKKISNFEFIWNNWIIPIIDDLYNQLDKNFKEFCNVEKRNLTKIQSEAEIFYLKKRTEIKKIFYGESSNNSLKKNYLMDSHKIGAILCRTMVEFKVFTYNIEKCKEYIKFKTSKNDTDWVVKNALINYRLAFYVSIVFLYYAMLFEYKDNDAKIYNKLKKQRQLNLYDISELTQEKTIRKNNKVAESFENSIVLDLARRDVNRCSFDCLMYSIILYQLEQYNMSLLLNIKDEENTLDIADKMDKKDANKREILPKRFDNEKYTVRKISASKQRQSIENDNVIKETE